MDATAVLLGSAIKEELAWVTVRSVSFGSMKHDRIFDSQVTLVATDAIDGRPQPRRARPISLVSKVEDECQRRRCLTITVDDRQT